MVKGDSMSDLHRKSCRHFTGTAEETCAKGVNYMSVRDTSGEGMARFPCLGAGNWRPCNTTCESFELYTKEELDEQDREVAAILLSLMDFEKRVTEDCPHCGKHVDRLDQVGRCVYARPCNCRVWQGRVPQAWRG